MIVTEAIEQAFQYAQGKPTPPAAGTPKHSALLLIADSVQQQWGNEPGIEWESLSDNVTLASAIGAGNVVALDADIKTIRKGSDDPILVNDEQYKLVSVSKLYRYRDSKVVAKQGRNLQFSDASDLTGAAVTVPATLYPDRITSGDDEIQVDDPWWLVYMMAAEFARNNIIKSTQYDNLLAYAENAMNKMKEDNTTQLEQLETVNFFQGEAL